MVGKLQTTEEIILKFLVKHLQKHDGEPTYEIIIQWMQLLYANAATLPTTLEGRRHGHIGMIMQPTLYATLSTDSIINQRIWDLYQFLDVLK